LAATNEKAALVSKPPHRTLAILMTIFAINFMDRQILAILGESLKADLALSDTQIGLLYGFAFAATFSIAAIPIARFADRRKRARIVVWSLVGFTVMTAACGLALNFWQLLVARVGVAVGEGGTNPPSHSLISDLYPTHRRSTAMAIFSLGPHFGILLGFLFGGVIAQLWGWRLAFIAAGIGGFAFALVSSRFLTEPNQVASGVGRERTASLWAILRSLDHCPSMRHLFAAGAVVSIAVYSLVGWLPSFLIREHGFSEGSAGAVLALVLGLAGAAGTTAGGLLSDRFGASNQGWRLRLVALVMLCVAPCWAMVFLVTDKTAMMIFLVLSGSMLGFHLGPTFAMVQSLAVRSMRASAAAILLLVANVLGLGLGPLAVGGLSDVLSRTFGSGSLRLALLLVVPFFVWAAYHYHAAARTLGADLEAVERQASMATVWRSPGPNAQAARHRPRSRG
jgi:predicted MFS family arabinose efflux permease